MIMCLSFRRFVSLRLPVTMNKTELECVFVTVCDSGVGTCACACKCICVHICVSL